MVRYGHRRIVAVVSVCLLKKIIYIYKVQINSKGRGSKCITTINDTSRDGDDISRFRVRADTAIVRSWTIPNLLRIGTGYDRYVSADAVILFDTANLDS